MYVSRMQMCCDVHRRVASVIEGVLVVDTWALAPCVGFHAFAVHRRTIAGMVVLVPSLV